MFKLLSVAIFAAMFYVSHQAKKKPCDDDINVRCWTVWFNSDTPCGTGDIETLDKLRQLYPGMICPNPTFIQAENVAKQTPDELGEVIQKCDTTSGFICLNKDQPNNKECSDYRVRFVCNPPYCEGVCWTQWYNRDKPSKTGDWETIKKLRRQYPGEICDTPLYIESVTKDDDTPAMMTGEVFFVYSPIHGFVCKNDDQDDHECLDYKVRFGCQCKSMP